MCDVSIKIYFFYNWSPNNFNFLEFYTTLMWFSALYSIDANE